MHINAEHRAVFLRQSSFRMFQVHVVLLDCPATQVRQVRAVQLANQATTVENVEQQDAQVDNLRRLAQKYYISPNLSDILQYHEPTRSLRLSNSHQFSVLRHNLSFGSRAFRFSAPRVWNSLPVIIRVSQSLPTFRRHLNTFHFQSAYPISAAHLA